MKAILVIDTPKECSDCPCINLLGIYCQADKRNRYCLLEDKEEWCPLKPMPQKENTFEKGLDEYGTGWRIGFNACIDEILGAENERR